MCSRVKDVTHHTANDDKLKAYAGCSDQVSPSKAESASHNENGASHVTTIMTERDKQNIFIK